ncbi:MAG: sodium:solute symporter [Gemmatimonadota bacterium]|nr:sodium:solute symporter [Gemmatimonadota bacterium]
MPTFTLGGIDLAMVVVYAVLIVAIGIYFGRKHEDAEEYFLAGRRMLWPVIGISLYASNMGSTALVGLTGDAYSTGISVFNYEWMAAVVLVVFAIFFAPFYIKTGVYTMPEFLERRYDGRSRYYFSGLTLFGNIVIDTAGHLYAGGLVLKLIFPDVPLAETIAILAVLAGIYTILGGLAAVMITDVIQTGLLLLGTVIVATVAFLKVGSWEAVTAVTPPEMLSLVRPMDDPAVPWLGLITGVPLLGFYFWGTNQFMVQRTLAAKNVHHARWGALLAAALKLPVIFLMVLPGTMARVLYPDLPNPDMVYPTMMFDMLPVGLRGLILTGLVAALMSSIDSTLNSASTLVTMDFVRKWKPQLDQRQLMRVGRVATAVFMVLAALWAPQIVHFGSLFKYLQSVLAYISPPIVAVFLLGVFWRRTTANGAFFALITGLVVSVTLFVANITGAAWMPDIHFLLVAPILFVFSLVAAVGVSLAGAPPAAEKVADTTWTPAFFRRESEELREMAWWKNYRIQSVALLAATAVVVLMFW